MDVETKSNETNDEPKTIDICSDGGVLKQIIKRGKGTKPMPGSNVEVHYVGTLTDGTKFDSSRDKNQPFTFTLGQGVIEGWNKCVATMKKGEIAKVTIRSDYGYGEQGTSGIPGGATLIFEIELLSFQNETDITKSKDKGVLKRILEKANDKAYEKPKYESVCSVHLTVYSGETIFEDVDKDIEIGGADSTDGLDIALESMKKEERALFIMKPNYCYGEKGNEALKIPPNTELTYNIKLNSFTAVKEKYGMELSEKKEVALRRKNQGNDLFSKNLFGQALKKYKKALELVEDDHKLEGEEKKQVNNDICLPCHLNTAMCSLKLKEYQKAVESANKALKIDSRNVKGLWRRGMARQELGLWEEAKRDFMECLSIDPENKPVQQSLVRLKTMMKKYDEQEAQKYKKLFA